MDAMGRIRNFNIHRDIDAMTDLIEVAFAGKLERWGGDLRGEMNEIKRMLPLLRVLVHISKRFRYYFDGFVWEDNGRVVSCVIVRPMGFDRTRWLIGNVATHPDYRRQGIARQLVTQAMHHAKAHGAVTCVLEVPSEAEPAYNLYRSLGFIHYDTSIDLKISVIPEVHVQPIEGYAIRNRKRGEWQPRYDLVLRETPPEVQAFLPVSKDEYRGSVVGRVIGPLVMRTLQRDVFRKILTKDGQVVASMDVVASISGDVHHELEMHFDPTHLDALAEPLLILAFQILKDYPRKNTLISVRGHCKEFVDLLRHYGFVETGVGHWLGANLVNQAPASGQGNVA